MTNGWSARRAARLSGPATALLLLIPVCAAAQEPVADFDQLDRRLRTGDTVWITDGSGREIKGTLSSLTPTALTIDARRPLTVRADDVRVVQLRRRDSLKNGAIIGAAAGLAAGGILLWGICRLEGGNPGCGASELFWGASAGAGMALGIAIDLALPGRKRVVYRSAGLPGAPPRARISISPILAPRKSGVAVTVSF